MQDDPALQLSSLNVHRLAITAILLAVKLMDDNYYNNTYYAKVSMAMGLEEGGGGFVATLLDTVCLQSLYLMFIF